MTYACRDKGDNKVLGEQKGEDAHFHKPVAFAEFLSMPPKRRVLPRQKPREASSGVHSSPFPSWASRSGLGPKSPVFKGGKNGPHLFMLQKKSLQGRDLVLRSS